MDCDGCTLCCKLLNVHWMDSPAGQWCKHCDIGKGCKVFTVAPDKCKEFECSYIQMEKVSIGLRPDKCKVIFEKIADDMFLGTLDPNSNLKSIVKRQIESFVNEGYSVVILSGKNKPMIRPTKDKAAKDVYNNFVEIVKAKKKHDSPIIYN